MQVHNQSSFIKVTEVWIPNKSRTRLELLSGIYGDLDGFREASKAESFAFDEGLPGKAWASAKPVVLNEFNVKNFKRTESALASGLTCGVAFPVFAGEFIMGVIVFLCGEIGDNLGAIEVWKSKTDFPYDIVVEDGYYGNLDDFAFISSKTRFRKGFGLPGLVWATNMPVILDDLGNSGLFSRSLHATKAQITTAIGIPCGCTPDQATVLCLLSSKEMPIALRYEIWVPAIDSTHLQIHSAICSDNPNHAQESENIIVNKGHGTLGMTWLTGSPMTCSDLANDASDPAESARAAHLQHVVSFPVIADGKLKAIVAWYF